MAIIWTAKITKLQLYRVFSRPMQAKSGSLYVSRNLPTYPFPKPTWTLYTSYLGQNTGLGEGEVSKFPETYNDPKILGFGMRNPVQGIQNPQTRDPESSTWIQNQEPSII